MHKIRFGLIGCGKVGGLHASAIASVPEAGLTAVCDSSLERAQAFAERHGARAFSSVREMAASGLVDAVNVCTPHPLHAEPVVEAAAHGIHALVEKPMAATLADCDRMLTAARAAGTRLGVISQRRWYPPVLRMKQAIEAGKIGRPILATFLMLSWRDEAYYRSDPWRGKWSTEGGGVLINQSAHQLDMLTWLGGEIGEVSGYWANLNHPYVEIEDTALAMIRYRNGALGSIVASVSQNPGIYTKVHVHGASGYSVGVQTDSGATFVAGMSGVQDAAFNDVWSIPGESALRDGYEAEDRRLFATVDATTYFHALQIQDFAQAIGHRREPAVTGEDGRRTVELFTAVYRSNEERHPVKFPIAS
jgi:UDP-N-acetyl-2-amino-2-deoxyglucuronate dehydrogenase